MKRIISALIILTAFLASCSKEISLTPGISFLTPEPEIYEETAIFRIIAQPFSSADSLKIPVVLGGTAQKGTDYEVSAEYFCLSKDSLTDSIVVSTNSLGTGKTVSLSLQIPDGFTAGKYPTSEFKLQDKYGFLTFESSRAFITDTTDFAVVVIDSTGKAKALSKDTEFNFSVNTEKSTAVEGVDFRLITQEIIGIPAGYSYNTFAIAPLKSSFGDGKDKIVLDVFADERFDAGIFAQMEVTMIRPELKAFEGSWSMDGVSTDAAYFENIWGSECTGYDLVPEFNSSSLFGVSFLGTTFIPAFSSGLENYFTGQSVMTIGPEIEIEGTDGQTRTVQLIGLDKTNRYFSPTEVSEDSLSYVGIYLYQDADGMKDMLDLYILDHTSRFFMPELEAGNKYGAEKPVAAEPGLYFCATFARL